MSNWRILVTRALLVGLFLTSTLGLGCKTASSGSLPVDSPLIPFQSSSEDAELEIDDQDLEPTEFVDPLAGSASEETISDKERSPKGE